MWVPPHDFEADPPSDKGEKVMSCHSPFVVYFKISVKVIASELDNPKHISSESVWNLQDQSCMMTHNGSYDSWKIAELNKINLV